MVRFRIKSVKIEGFRGFRKAQSIPVEGKHLFLFGRNETGKSSVVDAIRWCLAGGERETLWRNQFYDGNCQVDLYLSGSEGAWHVQRRLRPGGGRSDVVVFDMQGREHRLSSIFPHLPSLFTEEGIYVILAEQEPSLRRPPTNISHFDRVIYAYLGLEELVDLDERLGGLVQEYESRRQKLGSDIDKFKSRIEESWEEVGRSLKELLASPPWEGQAPTRAETFEKIRKLASSLARQREEQLPELSAELLLDHAKRLVEQSKSKNRESLEKQAQELQREIKQLNDLWVQYNDALVRLGELNKQISKLKEDLQKVCGGRTIDELKGELDHLEQEVQKKALLADILTKTEIFITQGAPCPVCSSAYEDLPSRIRSSLQGITSEQEQLVKQRDGVKKLYETARELSEKLSKIKSSARDLSVKATNLENELRRSLSLSESENLSERVKTWLEEKQGALRHIHEMIQDIERWAESRLLEIRNFRRELKFHDLRETQERIEWWLKEGRVEVEKALGALDDFLGTIQEAKRTLQETIEAALERIIPPLNELMTQVYQRLTQHSSFQQIRLKLDRDQSGSLDLFLKVESQLEPGHLYDPEDVLNGQALSAIRLLPYFVFSPLQAESLELNLLMLDDPSRTFDNERLRFLMEDLKNISSNAQLIIATHEAERFQNILNEFFSSGQYISINFKSFDPAQGPSFEQA